MAGYIFVTKEKVREEFGVKRISEKLRKHVISILRDEIQDLDTYLTEGFWGFNIQKLDESCGGFLGSDPDENGMMGRYIKPLIDDYLEKRGNYEQ